MIAEHDVRFVRLWFTDIAGTHKSVSLAPTEVEGAFSEGIGFDGSAIEGLTRAFESDLLVVPDPATFQLLPWRSAEQPTARMFCQIKTPQGELAAADPRGVLQRALAKARAMGFEFYTHPEIEFYLLEDDKTSAARHSDDFAVQPGDHRFGRVNSFGLQPVPVDIAGYFDNVPGGTAHDFRRISVNMLEEMGIAVEFSHHEAGPGQNEIDLRYADALTTADNIVTFRAVVKEVALAQGVQATFMPKPLAGRPGSGMHTHLSLFEGDKNVFYDPAAKYQLSITGRRFLAGLLRHAREIAAVTNQYVNSYKRLWGGDEAPAYVSWGHSNHSALARVPHYKPGKDGAARVEYRAIDSAVNPYLGFAVLLAAGLRGIEEEYELPPELEGSVGALSEMERRVLGCTPLPGSLDQALTLMEGSELVADTLGEQVFAFFLREKRLEVAAYQQQVTPYELSSMLGRV